MLNNKLICAVLVLFSAVILAGEPAGAKKNEDNTTRTVEGMVTDTANQPVSKAVVQLKNTKTLQNPFLHHCRRTTAAIILRGSELTSSTNSKPTMTAQALPGKL